MTTILCIDTSTEVCSVVLGNEDGVLFERVSREGRDHSEKAGVFVDEVLQEALLLGIEKPDAVAVCSGPGSYTGLRIGVSLAKGLCYGYEIPLIAIDSLKIMVDEVLRRDIVAASDALLLPMIDARRMEVYVSQWDVSSQLLWSPEAVIVDETTYSSFVDRTLYYFGTGAEKCVPLLNHENWHFIPDIAPMASSLLFSALDSFKQQKFEDVAYFEPFYLKQFQTTVSKKNVLGL